MKKFFSTLLFSSLVSIPLLAGSTAGEEVIVQGVPVEKASSRQNPQEEKLLLYFSQLSPTAQDKIVTEVKRQALRSQESKKKKGVIEVKQEALRSEESDDFSAALRVVDPMGGL